MKMEPSFFQKIAEEASTPVVIADDTLKIVFFNSGMEQLTGYPAREVVGKNYPELLIPPESRGALKQAFEEALSGEGVLRTSPVITSESVIKYVEWEIMPLKAKEGTLIVKIGRELTEHMVARQRLEASKRALSSLVESIPSMVYRCYPDPNQTFIFVNRWAERLTGYLVGGISPFGTARKLAVVVEKRVMAYEAVMINAGQRGKMLKMNPRDIVDLLACRVADISRE